MLANSACNQDRPTLVLFAYIALQVQIMLRICFNRGNLTCVFLGSADLGAPLHVPYRAPLVDTKDRRSQTLAIRSQWAPDSQNTLGKVTPSAAKLLATGHRTPEP